MDSDFRQTYPPIGDYAFISDCRSSALVSRAVPIDWYCMPRKHTGNRFARRGGRPDESGQEVAT